jgi:ABC-type polysaccharide/polyol phosphate export permease
LGAWLSIQEALTSCASSIVKNSAIVKNVAYPIVLFPLSSVICSFVSIVTTYCLLLILRSITGHLPGAPIIALPFVLIVQGIFVFGIGLYLSMIGTFFRDTLQILPMIFQIIMLATPVIYERKDVPAKLLFLIDYNPFYYLIDSYRKILFYGQWPDWLELCIVGFAGLMISIIGLKLFNGVRGYFEAVV